MFRRSVMALLVLAAALALPSLARAQAVGINYFDNANSSLPDGTVRITTPNYRVLATTLGHGLNQCAMIYVLKPDQEIASCCGCKLTPNQLLKLSVNNNVLASTLSPVTSGTIAIVPSFPNDPPTQAGNCNPGLTPVVGAFVTAWGTHVQDSGVITEDDFDFSTDAGARTTVAGLVGDCTTQVLGNGSGIGVCSCQEQPGT